MSEGPPYAPHPFLHAFVERQTRHAIAKHAAFHNQTEQQHRADVRAHLTRVAESGDLWFRMSHKRLEHALKVGYFQGGMYDPGRQTDLACVQMLINQAKDELLYGFVSDRHPMFGNQWVADTVVKLHPSVKLRATLLEGGTILNFTLGKFGFFTDHTRDFYQFLLGWDNNRDPDEQLLEFDALLDTLDARIGMTRRPELDSDQAPYLSPSRPESRPTYPTPSNDMSELSWQWMAPRGPLRQGQCPRCSGLVVGGIGQWEEPSYRLSLTRGDYARLAAQISGRIQVGEIEEIYIRSKDNCRKILPLANEHGIPIQYGTQQEREAE